MAQSRGRKASRTEVRQEPKSEEGFCVPFNFDELGNRRGAQGELKVELRVKLKLPWSPGQGEPSIPEKR